MTGYLTFVLAFVAILAVIGVAAWLVRRFATNRLGSGTNRGRMHCGTRGGRMVESCLPRE